MKHITISEAKREEAPIILDFIQKLAEYEQMTKYVTATVEDIEQFIFDQKKANVLFVRQKGKAIGFAVYFYSFSTFLSRPSLYLEDFYVLEKERGKGYGTKLIKELAKIAVENDCSRFEWSCLEWNSPSIAFYEKLGARSLQGWLQFRMEDEELLNFSKSL